MLHTDPEDKAVPIASQVFSQPQQQEPETATDSDAGAIDISANSQVAHQHDDTVSMMCVLLSLCLDT